MAYFSGHQSAIETIDQEFTVYGYSKGNDYTTIIIQKSLRLVLKNQHCLASHELLQTKLDTELSHNPEET